MSKTLKNYPLVVVSGDNTKYIVTVVYMVYGLPVFMHYRSSDMNELKEQLSVVFRKSFFLKKAQWCMEKLNKAFDVHHSKAKHWCDEYKIEYNPYLEIPDNCYKPPKG